MEQQDRDETIDRLLRGMRGDSRTGSSSSLCLDAETLAAWFENHLQGPARARAEAHAASCSRCQALLSAMARTGDVMADGAEGAEKSRSWMFRMAPWMAPLGAAAAALVVWIAVLPRLTAPPSPDQNPAVSAPAPSRADAAKEVAAPGQPAAQADSESLARRDRISALADSQKAGTRLQKPAEQVKPLEEKRESIQARAADTALPRAEAPVAAPGSAVPVPSPPPASAPAAPHVIQEERRSAAFASARATAARGAAVSQLPIVVSSPDPKIRWRIVAGSVVQQSTDEGATWIVQPTGIDVPLVAGSAPSSSVAWLVGGQGMVLLTTDGRTWQRVQFPEAVDLHAVTATSADAATVTAADGRSFVTTDRGKTWKR
jgi:hypothetical protein